MKPTHILRYLPFGIATILILAFLLEVLLTPNLLINTPIIFGGCGLVLVLALLIQKNGYWKYVFALLVLSALTPWVRFYNTSFFFGIGKLSVELTALALLIAHLSLNKEVVASVLEYFKDTEEEKAQQLENRIQGFESKFADKSQQELLHITKEKFLAPEAVEAAKRLLRKEE